MIFYLKIACLPFGNPYFDGDELIFRDNCGWFGCRPHSVSSPQLKRRRPVVAAAVVGVGLLPGSLSLSAEPVFEGGRAINTCAPLVGYVEVTDDGSAGFRVSVSLASDGWEQFPADSQFYHKRFITYDAVRHFPLLRGTFRYRGGWHTRGGVNGFWGTNIRYSTVYFDYFARGGTGGKYFYMDLIPVHTKLVHVRDKHYWPGDHYVNITLYVTDRDPYSRTNARLPNGGYLMHCWISDTDGNGYYVPVYLDNDGDGTFEQAF